MDVGRYHRSPRIAPCVRLRFGPTDEPRLISSRVFASFKFYLSIEPRLISSGVITRDVNSNSEIYAQKSTLAFGVGILATHRHDHGSSCTHVCRCVHEHRAQSHVSPPGWRVRRIFETRDRKSRQETKGNTDDWLP